MATKATADRGAQAAIGDILNHTCSLIGQLSGNSTVVIQNLHINAWPAPAAVAAPAGLIAYFGLTDWWQASLMEAERSVIENAIGDEVAKATISATSQTAHSWLRSVARRIGSVHPVLASKARAKACAIISGLEIDDYWLKQLDAIRRYWLRHDFQAARDELRAVGFRMREENALPDVVSLYDNLREEFMHADPYYAEVMDVVKPIIQSRPGLTQSILAKGLPEIDIERFRYVMYYGELIGDITRIKSGRSYGLYMGKT